MDPDLISRYDQRVPRYTSYPTAPHFSNAIQSEQYKSWLLSLDQSQKLSLYLHIPFCAELCWYCGCHTIVTRTTSAFQHYVDALKKEIDLVADLLPKKMDVSHMHWGGGTPTSLPAHLISDLLDHIHKRFNFSEKAEIAVEIDPRVLTKNQLTVLIEGGLTRASLGVQDFNEKVQTAIHRIQPYSTTKQVIDWLREGGIQEINLDLMYGLPYQSAEIISHSIKTALSLNPSRIALFGYAHVPWMKKHQTLLPEQHLPDTEERVEQMELAAQILSEAGYLSIGIDHFVLPDDIMAKKQKEGQLKRNFQGYTTDESDILIGFGASAIGSLPQGYCQNYPAINQYYESLNNKTLPVTRGIMITDEDRLRRSIIQRLMCDFWVDLSSEARQFNMPDYNFSKELEKLNHLERDGLLLRKGAVIQVSKDALPLVRQVCAIFDQYFDNKPVSYSKAL